MSVSVCVFVFKCDGPIKRWKVPYIYRNISIMANEDQLLLMLPSSEEDCMAMFLCEYGMCLCVCVLLHRLSVCVCLSNGK